ncbi:MULTISPECIES: class I SAM-dependent methyltransferase [unclassified Rummeliibacillus]|uniref:class I SAM-dependent methyltransferase n=1 Tax=unclassified Rummeliibacillus TaxID=2622809 RepID=UPI000E669888|nr:MULTISPECIES: class I SAM-dependent methyltransferase [unclassified Rummeliibacillus]RIJ66097.1 class I SAM-dependent methyltransferase [Rummeliibacillus sp. POC4]RPJ96668.1 class I SAM-dependent methyltransferase [Rummeliibacillus sp. TYF005]
MSEHYYSKKPQVESKPRRWNFTLRGFSFVFETDAGVFSKSEVDFGSRVLIDSFEMPTVEGCILDVGCGYGPIGLSIAKSYPNHIIHMMDVNERAVNLAKKNAELNGVQNVQIYESDALSSVQEEQVAVVLTNPPIRAGKNTIFRFYDEAYEKLVDLGELWIVIQKKQGAPSTVEHLELKFSKVEIVEKKKGYWIIKAVK